MLRHEILTNFIHFQGTKKFDFQPGVNIFIGQNNSGKSSVFEGARRCLGVKQNTTVSSAHFHDKRSEASCIFDIGNGHKLFSSMVRLPTEAADSKPIYVKVAYETAKKSIGIDLVKETETEAKTLVNESVEVEDISKIKDLIDKFLIDKVSDADVLKEICRIVSGKVESFKQNIELKEVQDTTACEQILQTYVNATTVFTFAVRGIGPIQWSKSKKTTNEFKAGNYKIAQERSEIIQWYLEESIANKCIKREDIERVEKYFKIITNNSDFKFEIQPTIGLVALHKKSGKRSGAGEDECKPFPIMKVPEGILEAMNCAILLGVSDFKTVCLEEPEKGMHPQMIDRLRELVIRKIENKTILLTSHHPSFLAPWTIPNLHIFKKIENENGTSFKACCGSDIEKGCPDKKTPRIVTSDHFASVFFAKRVLFVEGEGDYLFMSALKQLFLSNDDILVQLIKSESERFEDVREFLCSLHMINLSGETHKLRFSKLCEAIVTEKYFMLDYDAIENHEKSPKKFLKDFNLTQYEPDDVEKDVTILEEEGFFVWKAGGTDGKRSAIPGKSDRKGYAGTIEDVLIDLAKNHEGLKEFFVLNNVTLKFNENTKKQNRHKLFRSKDITDENITNVVEKVMQCCVKDKGENLSTEMLRLVNFLVEKSVKSKP